MLNIADVFSFILSFIVIYFTFLFLSKLRRKDVFKKRLEGFIPDKEPHPQKDLPLKQAYQPQGKGLFSFCRKIIDKIQMSGAAEKEILKKKFEKAGIRSNNAAFIYGVAKLTIIFPCSMISAYIVFKYNSLDIFYKILIILSSALLGSLLIDFVLNLLENSRKNRVLKAFPEALDLMVICTEAGLSLPATIQRVAREIAPISPDLGYELSLLSIELKMLPDWRKALQNFSDRLDSVYFKSIISNISQSEQHGTPIAQTMRTVSEEFRVNRLLKAEEKASRLPVLLTLPMMLFIFPCVFIIILGPAAINILSQFKS